MSDCLVLACSGLCHFLSHGAKTGAAAAKGGWMGFGASRFGSGVFSVAFSGPFQGFYQLIFLVFYQVSDLFADQVMG